jgi:nucleotide-binding universal stress UspA family protein
VIESGEAPDLWRSAAELNTAETAIREATDLPVKIEVETLLGDLTETLLEASQSAAMICVASPPASTARRDRAGSTAAALATSARCPIAVVRVGPTVSGGPGWIVVDLDESPASDAVLERGLDEARLRQAPLRVLTRSQLRFPDIHDTGAAAYPNRWAKACLDHRLAPWRDRYPDVEMKAVAVHGNTLAYLARNLASIQLVVAGGDGVDGLGDLLSPPGRAAIRCTDCSVMICQTPSPL